METKEGVALLAAQLSRMEAKLDVVKDHCAATDVTLTKNTSDIAYHIRRTDALEARVEQVATELRPVTDHVTRLKGAAWLLGVALTVLEAWHWWRG